jgi:hypothetical protein
MWRMFSVVAWSVAIYLMWRLIVEFKMSDRARIFTLVAFGLTPAAVWLTTPLLLQVASVPFTLAGLLAIMIAIRRRQIHLVAVAALLMNIAFFTRISSAVVGVIGALMIIVLASGRERWKLLGVYILTGLVIFGIIFGAGTAVLGLDKTAIMFNLEAFIIAQDRSDIAQAQTATEPIIRQLVVQAGLLWQGGLPYLMAIFLLPALWLPRNKALAIGAVTAVFGVMGLVFFHLIDTNFMLPATLPVVQATIFFLIGICPAMAALAQLLYGSSGRAGNRQSGVTILVITWLVLLVLAYAHWGRFIANYLVEFLPPLALLVGLVGDGILLASKHWQPRWLVHVVLSLAGIALLASWGQGTWIMNKYPFTGTVDAGSLQAMVKEVWRHVPAHTAIFTAEPIVTSFANRPIVFAYSHPGWYREALLGTLPWSLVRLLFKDPAEVTVYLRDQAQFVLLDKRTNEIYFDQYPERRAILQQDFNQIASVHNDAAGDTFELYQRNGQ